jgi:hypothetical protein
MTQFRVPRQYVGGLRALSSLTDEEATQLHGRLAAAEKFQPVGELERMISEALPERVRAASDEILSALLALRTQLRSGGGQVAKLAQLAASDPRLGDTQSASGTKLATLLTELLGTEAIATTAAAAELLIQHERPYRAARIISEIRPVFGEDTKEPPPGAILVHRLQITHWTPDSGVWTTEFALDQSDLTQLRDVISRAFDKSQSLRSLLKASGVESFDVGSGF